MSIEEVISERVKKVGITAAELARRCGMSDVLLRRSLDGKRPVKSAEFLNLCRELDLTLEDFEECEN